MQDGPARRIGALLAACTLVGAGVAACGGDEEEEPPEEVGVSWRRGETWGHRDVFFGFDRVAVGSSPDTVAWVSRRLDGDTAALAYSEIEAGGADTRHVDLPVAGNPAVLIPVHAAVDEEGWAVVAATRDRPNAVNTGLVAWQALRSQHEADVGPGVRLVPPAGVSGPPELANVGRVDGTTVVAALFNGRPALWTAPDRTTTPPPGGRAVRPATWMGAQPDLGLDADLVNLRVVGDGERLVLAGVDDRARAHLWTSTDGERWEPLPRRRLPRNVGAVGLMARLDDRQVVVGWLADEGSAPWNATRATIQRLEGGELVDEGQIVAADDQGSGGDSGGGGGDVRIERLDLGGAVRSPGGRLVVVGAALRPNGDTTPMIWARDRDRWVPTSQPELAHRLDYEFRTVAASDQLMVGLVTPVAHVDVETWRWRPPVRD